MKKNLGLMAVTVSLLVGSAAPARANIWDWMQEWSGPGPFTHRTKYPEPMVSLCAAGYRDGPDENPYRVSQVHMDDVFCFFGSYRDMTADPNNNFPVPVRARFFEFGVMNRSPVWRLRDSVELAYTIGLLKTDAERVGDIGGGSLKRFQITAPRATFKVLLVPFEMWSSQPLGARWVDTIGNGWVKTLLSVPKAHVGATWIFGKLSSSDLGVDDTKYQFEESHEYVLSRGVFLDFGELLARTKVWSR